jgi:hypothetical protein
MTLDTLQDPVEAPVGAFAIKHGIILGLISIGISLIVYLTGNMASSWASWVTLPVYIYLIFFFQKKFRDQEQGGYIRYGKAFGVGFLMTVVSSVLSAIYTFFVFQDSDVIDQIMEKSYNDMVDQGMSSGEIDQAMSMMEPFMTPGMMVMWATVGGLFMGLIICLITSAIVKKEHSFN